MWVRHDVDWRTLLSKVIRVQRLVWECVCVCVAFPWRFFSLLFYFTNHVRLRHLCLRSYLRLVFGERWHWRTTGRCSLSFYCRHGSHGRTNYIWRMCGVQGEILAVYNGKHTHVSGCPTHPHWLPPFDADLRFVQKSISRFKIREEKKKKEQAKLTRTAIMIRIAIISTLSGRLVNHSSKTSLTFTLSWACASVFLASVWSLVSSNITSANLHLTEVIMIHGGFQI